MAYSYSSNGLLASRSSTYCLFIGLSSVVVPIGDMRQIIFPTSSATKIALTNQSRLQQVAQMHHLDRLKNQSIHLVAYQKVDHFETVQK